MRIIIIAGPNGAGKTALAREYLRTKAGDPPFVNGDDIAEELNPGRPEAVAPAAARLALRQMDAYAEEGVDFAVETTLSGRVYAQRIRRWRARGYHVSIIYLRLSSADQVVQRIEQRVLEGGHGIPEAVARRRYRRSWRNFSEVYRDIVDHWRIYDTSGPVPTLVAASDDPPAVREPRPGWGVGANPAQEPHRARQTEDRLHATLQRKAVVSSPGRIPDGEPSDENVLAALVRARDRALARAATAGRGETGDRRRPSARETDANPVHTGAAIQGSRVLCRKRAPAARGGVVEKRTMARECAREHLGG